MSLRAHVDVHGRRKRSRLFLLFLSDYHCEVLPKRAFEGVALAESRTLLSENIQPPTQAFPVQIPAAVWMLREH